jgi:hypothetical protein
MKFASFDQIREIRTTRFSFGRVEVDHVFGSTRTYDSAGHIIAEHWGAPRGKLLLLGGEEGVGKTKWYSDTLIMLLFAGLRVAVIQMEMEPGEYKNTLMNMHRALGLGETLKNSENLFVMRLHTPEEHAEAIREIHPDIVFFDSFPQIRGNNSKAGIDHIVLDCLKPALIEENCCGILIAHLNNEGQIKGNNHIRYMVDGVFRMAWADKPETPEEEGNPSLYKNRCKLVAAKNRGGEKGACVYQQHRGDAFAVVPTPKIPAPLPDDELVFDEEETIELLRVKPVKRMVDGEKTPVFSSNTMIPHTAGHYDPMAWVNMGNRKGLKRK